MNCIISSFGKSVKKMRALTGKQTEVKHFSTLLEIISYTPMYSAVTVMEFNVRNILLKNGTDFTKP